MIDQDRAAMQQALNAVCGAKLCEFNSMSSRREQQRLMDKATTILRAALAQEQPEPAQEPVAWWKRHRDGSVELNDARTFMAEDAIATGRRPLVFGDTTTPPQRPPLTDEEIRDAVQEADLDWQAGWTLAEHEPNRFTTLARAIERKVRGE